MGDQRLHSDQLKARPIGEGTSSGMIYGEIPSSSGRTRASNSVSSRPLSAQTPMVGLLTRRVP
jgi:hypothetical protein